MFKKLLLPLALMGTAVFAHADYSINYDINLDSNFTLYDGVVHENTFGVTQSYSFSGPGEVTFSDYFNKDYVPPAATFFGLVDDPDGTTHFAYLLNSTAAATAIGNSFENVFSGGYTEDQLITAVQDINSGDSDLMNQGFNVIFPFLSANDQLNVAVGVNGVTADTGTLVEFSNGVALGTGTVQAAPEPTTMAVLGLGGLIVARRRKARAKA